MLQVICPEDHRGDQQIHERTGERDPELFLGLGRTFQPCHAADWKHYDLQSSDALSPANEGMPQLMQQHGCYQSDDQERVRNWRLIATQPGDDQKNQKHDKREMQTDGHTHELNGPDGARASSSWRDSFLCHPTSGLNLPQVETLIWISPGCRRPACCRRKRATL